MKPDPQQIPTPDEIERRASACGLTIPQFSERARVANSTFYLWRTGQRTPNLRTLNRWLDTLTELEAEAGKPAA